MINEGLDAIQQRLVALFGSFIAPVLDYLWLLQWYELGGLLLVVCFVIGYFAPFAWVRASLGFILLLYAAFNAGVQVAWNHMRKKERE